MTTEHMSCQSQESGHETFGFVAPPRCLRRHVGHSEGRKGGFRGQNCESEMPHLVIDYWLNRDSHQCFLHSMYVMRRIRPAERPAMTNWWMERTFSRVWILSSMALVWK